MANTTFDPNIPTKIPRITLKERLGFAPQSDGFLVYQKDNQKGFYYFEGGKWFYLQAVTSTAGSVRPSKPYLGQSFFDTVLNYRIDWNGSTWVNGEGASV
jgi:hypothetical protein